MKFFFILKSHFKGISYFYEILLKLNRYVAFKLQIVSWMYSKKRNFKIFKIMSWDKLLIIIVMTDMTAKTYINLYTCAQVRKGFGHFYLSKPSLNSVSDSYKGIYLSSICHIRHLSVIQIIIPLKTPFWLKIVTFF